MSTKTEPGKCSKDVDRGDSQWSNFEPCGRDAAGKDDKGNPLCKLHLRVLERQKERDREWQESRRWGKELQATADRLSEHLGIQISPEYRMSFSLRGGGYTGRMVVPLEWLKKIAGMEKENVEPK